ncbi:unnamed protein product [Schistosoma spindalis]|nr:unnamed protein product [Schistosoma spindale]
MISEPNSFITLPVVIVFSCIVCCSKILRKNKRLPSNQLLCVINIHFSHQFVRVWRWSCRTEVCADRNVHKLRLVEKQEYETFIRIKRHHRLMTDYSITLSVNRYENS